VIALTLLERQWLPLSPKELIEGTLFLLVPIVAHNEWRHRKREREAERRHAELLSNTNPPEVQ
jgi:hypothetical protein